MVPWAATCCHSLHFSIPSSLPNEICFFSWTNVQTGISRQYCTDPLVCHIMYFCTCPNVLPKCTPMYSLTYLLYYVHCSTVHCRKPGSFCLTLIAQELNLFGATTGHQYSPAFITIFLVLKHLQVYSSTDNI